jgi:hypothetical protein
MSGATEKVRTKAKARPPLTPEEWEARINLIVQVISGLSQMLTGKNKQKYILPDDAPAKTEYTNLIKSLQHTVVFYKKLCKKQKRVTKRVATGGNRGFKQERYVSAKTVAFVNAHGDFTEALKLKPQVEIGGSAVWNIAQCTQLFTWYLDNAKLKNDAKRSEVRLNDALISLFGEFFSTLDKKQIWEKDGARYITHTALQHLIPLLFDRSIPVLPSLLTKEVTEALVAREKELKSRTDANRKKREDAKNAVKVARKAALDAKKAAVAAANAATAAAAVAATAPAAVPVK